MANLLITGGAGYIGSVISELALKQGHIVKIIDLLWFKKDVPLAYQLNSNYQFIKGDICDIDLMKRLLEGVDFVIHTAAVVGEPATKKFPELTSKINGEATIALINQAAENGIKGFIFFSTCSNYGISKGKATEDTPLKPLSLYAETKVNVEKYLMGEKMDLNWVICRISTVYGESPRMRFDLTVNDFVMNAFTKKYLDVFLPYTYRPYIHVLDVAKIILQIIDRFDEVKNNVFNIGFNRHNFQKIQIAKMVKKFIPDASINIIKEGTDLRDYQVDFSKLHKYLRMKNSRTIEDGIAETLTLLNKGVIKNPYAMEYYNTQPQIGV